PAGEGRRRGPRPPAPRDSLPRARPLPAAGAREDHVGLFEAARGDPARRREEDRAAVLGRASKLTTETPRHGGAAGDRSKEPIRTETEELNQSGLVPSIDPGRFAASGRPAAAPLRLAEKKACSATPCLCGQS